MQKTQMKITVQEDNLAQLQQVIDDLDKMYIEIGIFGEDDEFYTMIAGVHEFGMTIKAKGSALTIPTEHAKGRSAGEIPGLFRPKGKDYLAVSEDGELKIMFFLRKSVKIPERSFIRSTFDEEEKNWTAFLEERLDRVLQFEMSVEQMFEQMGAKAVADIQRKMTSLRSPANADITVKNKGSSNPLIDTGGMRQRVTWKVRKR
ncbi:hypothetical protein [Indiicoccus explosivorum]|uniref:hypothetical protein n=1 Tax=Indiicoccus explosivorum TaxID=1917864 RepID=UPI0019D39A7B|nr:hypothetical protein [Indiicoccus explosivorum]